MVKLSCGGEPADVVPDCLFYCFPFLYSGWRRHCGVVPFLFLFIRRCFDYFAFYLLQRQSPFIRKQKARPETRLVLPRNVNWAVLYFGIESLYLKVRCEKSKIYASILVIFIIFRHCNDFILISVFVAAFIYRIGNSFSIKEILEILSTKWLPIWTGKTSWFFYF